MKASSFGSLIALALAATGCESGLIGHDEETRVEPADTTFFFEYAPINSETYPQEEPAPPTLIDGLLYRATVTPEDTVLGSEPMDLWMYVTVQNPREQTVILPVRGCTVWPRVYATPDRSGAPVWTPQGQCLQANYSVSIDPGKTAEFPFLAHDAMLSSALPDGRYYLTLDFRGEEKTQEFRAGSADVRLREPGLEYSVSLIPSDRSVRVEVGVTNRNGVPIWLEYGQCSLSLALFRDLERTDLIGPWYATDYCEDYLAISTVGPGETLKAEEFGRDFSFDRVPVQGSGRYYLTVRLDLNWRTYDFPVGEMRRN